MAQFTSPIHLNSRTDCQDMDPMTDNKNIKVLVVEGNSEARSTIRCSFVASGNFDLEFCSSNQEVLGKVGKFAPDVVFLDASLREESCIETLQMLQAIPEMKSVPIVLAAGRRLQNRISSLYDLGAATVITRPYDLFTIPGHVVRTWEQAHA